MLHSVNTFDLRTVPVALDFPQLFQRQQRRSVCGADAQWGLWARSRPHREPRTFSRIITLRRKTGVTGATTQKHKHFHTGTRGVFSSLRYPELILLGGGSHQHANLIDVASRRSWSYTIMHKTQTVPSPSLSLKTRESQTFLHPLRFSTFVCYSRLQYLQKRNSILFANKYMYNIFTI